MDNTLAQLLTYVVELEQRIMQLNQEIEALRAKAQENGKVVTAKASK